MKGRISGGKVAVVDDCRLNQLQCSVANHNWGVPEWHGEISPMARNEGGHVIPVVMGKSDHLRVGKDVMIIELDGSDPDGHRIVVTALGRD